jgi:hypothetical protein
MKRLFIALSLGLGLVFPFAAGVAQQPKPANPEAITQISVQRTWCYGVCPIDELVLNSDGSATYSGFRNTPRSGFFKGTLPSDQFSKLAAWLEDQNFFELKSEIGHGNTDSADFIVSVTRGYRSYSVIFRIGESQKLTEKMKKMLLGAGETISWKRDEVASPNGIKGTLRRPLTAEETQIFRNRKPPITETSMQFALVTLDPLDHDGPPITTRSDQEGRFQFFALPGRYGLSASTRNYAERFSLTALFLRAEPQTVNVEIGKFAAPIIKFEDKTPPNR